MSDTDEFSIIPLEHKHTAQIERWPSRHSAASALLKTPVITAGPSPDNYGWVAVNGDEVLAVATVRLNQERVGYLNCIVKPSSKRKGLTNSLIAHILNQAPVKDIVHLHAAVEPANTAARQALKEHGFTMVGNDQNGYLEYARHKHY
ncbi:MAG TPA: GNAT family N-acetyltransferase [Candidatus Saccharimonadales bacterium]|nr:GNAT family N-acetyltransferase [Candidatus Saccharimonadales bacterium]